MQNFMPSNIFLLYKIAIRRSPTITPSPAMTPRSLTVECSTKTWIVHIGLTGTGDKTAHFKLFPRHLPRQRRSFPLLPIKGFLKERDELALGSRTATYSSCPSPTTSKIRSHHIQQMYLMMANQHSGHQANVHLCLGKFSTASQASLDMIADRIQLADYTNPQTQTKGPTSQSQYYSIF